MAAGGQWWAVWREHVAPGGSPGDEDVQVDGTTTYVAWNRDGRTVAADNRGGSFASHTFNTPGIQSARPRIAILSGSVTVGVILSIGSRLYATSEA